MIDYSQGNDWDMTNIKNMDDFHKPAFDGIGFEDNLMPYVQAIELIQDE